MKKETNTGSKNTGDCNSGDCNSGADIFKEITGIDVEANDDKMEEAMELLKKNGYKVVKE